MIYIFTEAITQYLFSVSLPLIMRGFFMISVIGTIKNFKVVL